MTPFDESFAVEAMIKALKQFHVLDGRITELHAHTALSALRPFLGDGWRTMESAPKDGTPVLLFARHINATAPVLVVGHYNGEEFGWIAVSFVPHGPMQIVPRAWQPLPDFPPDSGKEG